MTDDKVPTGTEIEERWRLSEDELQRIVKAAEQAILTGVGSLHTRRDRTTCAKGTRCWPRPAHYLG